VSAPRCLQCGGPRTFRTLPCHVGGPWLESQELRFLFIDPQRMPAFTGLDSWEFNFLLELVSPRGTAKRPSRVHAREAGMFEFNLPIHENRVDPFR